MAESDEVDRKFELECRKLQAEIKNIESRWWKPAAIQATPAILLLAASIALAWSTGVLDAKRDHLAAQNERLLIQQLRLQDEEKKIKTEIGSLQTVLADTKTDLEGFRAERLAIASLATGDVDATVRFSLESDAYEVELRKARPIAFSVDYAPGTIIDQYPLLTAIRTASALRRISSITIRDFELTEIELAAIGSLRTVESIRTVNCGLTDDRMKHFPLLPKLRSLCLMNEKFTRLGAIQAYSTLENLYVFKTPLNDEGLQQLWPLKSTLKVLSIEGSNVSDKSLDFLSGFLHLERIIVVGTSLTESGIRVLASMGQLKSIEIGGTQLSAESQNEIQRGRPQLSIDRRPAMSAPPPRRPELPIVE